MKTEWLSDLFVDGGLLVTPSTPQERLADLDRGEVVTLFEHYGVLLFRGFGLAPERLTAFTDRFTERYAADAVRRAARFGQKAVHDVDDGRGAVALHSEASFAATWPELIWFYCHVAPHTGGGTTLADGMLLWRHLSEPTQRIFLAQPLRYQVAIPIGERREGGGREPWISTTPGISGFLNWEEGVVELTVLRYAVHEARVRRGGSLCFANHLLCRREPQIKDVAFADGSPIPPEVFVEIAEVGERLTWEVRWEPGDLVMLDNRRFMHGRRAFPEGVTRDIVQVQTERAGFAYGATTRRPRA